jgi:hypothetical protein
MTDEKNEKSPVGGKAGGVDDVYLWACPLAWWQQQWGRLTGQTKWLGNSGSDCPDDHSPYGMGDPQQ